MKNIYGSFFVSILDYKNNMYYKTKEKTLNLATERRR